MMSFWPFRSGRTEPLPRFFHYAATIGRHQYVWGGSDTSRRTSASVVEIFDPSVEAWHQRELTGLHLPLKIHSGCCTSVEEGLYTYGGYNARTFGFDNSLSFLSVPSLQWSGIEPVNRIEGPMKKSACGIVSCHGGRALAVFGGYGYPDGSIQAESEFHVDKDISGIEIEDVDSVIGWTNEFHIFRLSEGLWTSPSTTGQKPPPIANFTFTGVNSHRAVLFGGRQRQCRSSDLFIVDFDPEKPHWTKIDKVDGEPWPSARSAHAACCICYGAEGAKVLMSGGVDTRGNTLNDVWLFDPFMNKWNELTLSENQLPRCGHSITISSFGQNCAKATIFGGCPKWPGADVPNDRWPNMADTTVLVLELSHHGESLTSCREWKVTSVVSGKELGTSQRARAMVQYMQSAMDEAEERLQSLSEEVAMLHQRLQEERDNTLHTPQDLSWVLQDSDFDIDLTGNEIGRGAWAIVRTATFRGTTVAAKSLHQEIGSPYHQETFVREMTLASRIRHPNLLQFIGATLQGRLIILTELMPTSLRAELDRRTITPEHVIPISLCIIRALNYLHLVKPDPIIHRDISSANILLEPIHGNSWKAKVSDFGSANFLRQVATVGPGNPTYAAPEASTPQQQSAKMDIYSFGILQVEICTCRFPAENEREELIDSIRLPRMVTLIRQCINQEAEHRPDAVEVMEVLTGMSIN